MSLDMQKFADRTLKPQFAAGEVTEQTIKDSTNAKWLFDVMGATDLHHGLRAAAQRRLRRLSNQRGLRC